MQPLPASLTDRFAAVLAPGSFFSPVSIELAVALVAAGAQGQTLAELQQALQWPTTVKWQQELAQRFAPLYAALASDPSLIAVACRVYSRTLVRPQYVADVQSVFRAGIEQLKSAAQINEFVSQSTRGMIENIVDDRAIAAARLVAVNALYFKGRWAVAFCREDTQVAAFHVAGGGSSPCHMMRTAADQKWHYHEDATAQYVKLPYRDAAGAISPFAALVVLPRASKTNALEGTDWKGALEHMSAAPKKEGTLWLPRFDLETSVELNDAMKLLGVRRAFEDTAEFGGVSGEPLKIDVVVHKVKVKVDEEGTVAAAVTVVHMHDACSAAPRSFQRFQMTCDRPFAFCIVAEPSFPAVTQAARYTPLVLFAGTVANPGAVGPKPQAPEPLELDDASCPTTGLNHFISAVNLTEQISLEPAEDHNSNGFKLRANELSMIKSMAAKALLAVRQEPHDEGTKILLGEVDRRMDCILMRPRVNRLKPQFTIQNNADKFSHVVDDFLFIGGGGSNEEPHAFMVPMKPGQDQHQSPHFVRISEFIKTHNIKFILNVSRELMPQQQQRDYVVMPSQRFFCKEKDDLEPLRLIATNKLTSKNLQSIISVLVPMADLDEFSSEFQDHVATAALALELAWQRYVTAVARFPSEPPPRVFLHCTGGLNRSPFTAVYWLVHYHGISVDEAWRCVLERRKHECSIQRPPLNSNRKDGKAAWRTGLLQSAPNIQWPQLQLGRSIIQDAKSSINALLNGSLPHPHVGIDDRPPWSPLVRPPVVNPQVDKPEVVVYILQASSIPGFIAIDALRQLMSRFPSCLTRTLKCRPSNTLQEAALPLQEFQVKFSDKQSAEQCHLALNGHPFLDFRPEFGPVRSIVRTVSNAKITFLVASNIPMFPKENIVQLLATHEGMMRNEVEIIDTGNCHVFVQESASNPNSSALKQSTTPLLTVLAHAIERKLIESSLSSDKAKQWVKVLQHEFTHIPKEQIKHTVIQMCKYDNEDGVKQLSLKPGLYLTRICRIQARFTDSISAQRCRDFLAGRPFSFLCDIGPVQELEVVEVKERHYLKWQETQQQVQRHHGFFRTESSHQQIQSHHDLIQGLPCQEIQPTPHTLRSCNGAEALEDVQVAVAPMLLSDEMSGNQPKRQRTVITIDSSSDESDNDDHQTLLSDPSRGGDVGAEALEDVQVALAPMLLSDEMSGIQPNRRTPIIMDGGGANEWENFDELFDADENEMDEGISLKSGDSIAPEFGILCNVAQASGNCAVVKGRGRPVGFVVSAETKAKIAETRRQNKKATALRGESNVPSAAPDGHVPQPSCNSDEAFMNDEDEYGSQSSKSSHATVLDSDVKHSVVNVSSDDSQSVEHDPIDHINFEARVPISAGRMPNRPRVGNDDRNVNSRMSPPPARSQSPVPGIGGSILPASNLQRSRDSIGAVITPIPADKRHKARVDYEEQLRLEQQSHAVKWDDSRHNKSRKGDLFVFSHYQIEVAIRMIDDVKPPSERLHSWATNEGQQDRNVLVLSGVICTLPWSEWLEIGGPKRVQGTQPIKANLIPIVQRVRMEYM